MSAAQAPMTWRIRTGLALFVASIGWPVLIPVLPLLGVSAAATATFGGVMVVAAEVLMLAGAAIAGKEGFALIKAQVFGLLGMNGPVREVGPRRYTVGLVLFTSALAFAWASPYFGHHLPRYATGAWVYAVAFDGLLLISLFVLGGGFWNKLRSLFRHDASAAAPEERPG